MPVLIKSVTVEFDNGSTVNFQGRQEYLQEALDVLERPFRLRSALVDRLQPKIAIPPVVPKP